MAYIDIKNKNWNEVIKDLKKKKLLTRVKTRELVKEILIASNLNMTKVKNKKLEWSNKTLWKSLICRSW